MVKSLWPNRQLSRGARSVLNVTNVQKASRGLPAAHAFDREREDETVPRWGIEQQGELAASPAHTRQ